MNPWAKVRREIAGYQLVLHCLTIKELRDLKDRVRVGRITGFEAVALDLIDGEIKNKNDRLNVEEVRK